MKKYVMIRGTEEQMDRIGDIVDAEASEMFEDGTVDVIGWVEENSISLLAGLVGSVKEID